MREKVWVISGNIMVISLKLVLIIWYQSKPSPGKQLTLFIWYVTVWWIIASRLWPALVSSCHQTHTVVTWRQVLVHQSWASSLPLHNIWLMTIKYNCTDNRHTAETWNRQLVCVSTHIGDISGSFEILSRFPLNNVLRRLSNIPQQCTMASIIIFLLFSECGLKKM